MAKREPLTATPDAIALLIADHRQVDELFQRFESEEDSRAKVQLAEEICNQLTIHATAEEELFYPQTVAAFEAAGIEETDLVWEATVEHGTLEGLIDALRGTSAGDEMFEAHMKVLKEYVKHHVKEEEGEMFPRVRESGLDLQQLGEAIAMRKEALKEELGLVPPARKSAARKR